MEAFHLITDNTYSIHANALEYNGMAIIVIGSSGSGKSTLCYKLLKHGFKLISDDQVYYLENTNVVINPYFPLIKLKHTDEFIQVPNHLSCEKNYLSISTIIELDKKHGQTSIIDKFIKSNIKLISLQKRNLFSIIQKELINANSYN